MRQITLQGLTIRNFKGCQQLHLPLNGRNANIYGDNSAGKTTIYDALTWLLFGKDSLGQSNFDIKPLDEDNKVRDHGAVTEVEGQFLVDGEALSLRKTYFERWSIKRGSAQSSYDGNTSEYYADGVPVKKYEFEQRVDGLVTESRFQMLTKVLWFCEGMDWRERREVLFEVCGVVPDHEMMAGMPQFTPLLEAMGHLSTDELKKKLQAQRKGISGARDSTPARLDECKKTVEELSTIDFTALATQRKEHATKLEQLQGELLKLDHGALLDSKRNQLAAIQNQLVTYRNENDSHRQSQMIAVEDKTPSLRAALEQAQKEALHWTQLSQNEASLMAQLEQRIQDYRQRWAQADAAVFQTASCPTCAQSLPQEAQVAAQASFIAQQNRQKEEAVVGAQREKENLAQSTQRKEQYSASAAAAQQQVATLEEQLASDIPAVQPPVSDLPTHQGRMEAATAQLRALEGEIAQLEGESSAIRSEIGLAITALRQQVMQLDQELGKQSMLQYAKDRMDALRLEAREAASQLEELDKLLFLCDQFTRHKVRYIEDGINSRFGMVKFRLFQEQVNGALSDCCDVMVKGIPFKNVNDGARVNAGLDVIETLSRHFGVSVPLLIDKAESVTALRPVSTQVIRLVVREDAKELRVEYGT